MADRTSRLIVRLIDGVSGPARVAARSLTALQAAGRATAALGHTRQIAANARALVSNTRQMAYAVSAPLALVGAIGAKTAFEFEKAGNFLEALGEATGEQRKQFEDLANVLNAKYPQTLTEILKTGTELLKAGLDWHQMLGAMDPTLATAILGDMKPSEVATMISASLNAFQMPMETMEQALASTTTVSDRLSYAAVKSTATLRDMGEMFKYVAGAAAATGNTIDDVTAFAMAFSKNKVNGSEAGVALRSAIVRLAKGSTKQGRAALERADMPLSKYQRGQQKVTSDRVISALMADGIDATPIKKQLDALVNDPSLQNAPVRMGAKVAALVQEHLTKSGSAIDASVVANAVQESIVAAGSKIDLMAFFMDLKQKVASGVLSMGDLNHILEGRHFAKYQALLQSDLRQLKDDIINNSAGFTAEKYEITLKGMVRATYELTAALEGLAVALGKSVFADVAKAFRSITGWIEQVSAANPAMLRWTTLALGAVAVLGPLGLGIAGVVAGLGALVKVGAIAIGVVALIGAWPAAMVAGLAALGVAIYANWDTVKRWASESIDGLKRMATALGELPGRISTSLKEASHGLFEAGANLLQQVWDGMKSKLGQILGWVPVIGPAIRGGMNLLGGGAAPGGASPTPRAAGGNVTRGRAYVVGERRRELFFPGQSGTIHPTTNVGGRGGASVTLNQTFNVSGAQDPQSFVQDVRRIMADEVNEAFRGLQADVGLGFA